MDISILQKVSFFVLLFLYNLSLFNFSDSIFENRRTKKWFLLVICFTNSLLFIIVLSSLNLNAPEIYVLIFVTLFIELFLLYKETVLRVLLMTSAYSIHIMSFRAIIIGLTALIFDVNIFEAASSVNIINSINISLGLLVIAFIIVKKVFPPRQIKIIFQHNEQLKFLTIWFLVANAYFIFNSFMLLKDEYTLFSKYNLISVTITLFFAFSIVMVFTYKVGVFLNYKEKSEHLTNATEDEKEYKNSIMGQALLAFEVNLTQNKLLSGFASTYGTFELDNDSYTDLIFQALVTFLHPDDKEKFINFMSIDNLLKKYHNGHTELNFEYRIYNVTEKHYMWVKSIFNIYDSASSDSVMAFTYVKDITVEKQLEIEIKYKSERDALTGLYNHGMTKRLINEFLTRQKSNVCGALLLIDVDNFKQVNDNFGHGFGDEVLCDVSKKLSKIFRCNQKSNSQRKDDDIIGRIGGDEFMVFVKTSDVQRLTECAKEICKSIRTTFTTTDGREITISSSVGIAIVSSPKDNFKILYPQADIALYQSKHKGKNTYTFFSENNQ